MLKRCKVLLCILLMLGMIGFNKSYANEDVDNYYNLSGENRYSTSYNVSNKYDEISKEYGNRTDNVIIVSGENYPDAISAIPLSSKLEAPILLTTENYFSEELVKELERLEVKNIFIVGGKISSLLSGRLSNVYTIKTFVGNDRYDTNIKINDFVGFSTKNAIIVTGANYPDALSIGSYVYQKKVPLYLSATKTQDALIKKLETKGISDITIIGGKSSVDDTLENRAEFNIERIFGNDRYDTSELVAKKYFKDSENGVYTIGSDFPDALSSVTLAGKLNAPIILTSGNIDKIKYNNLIKNHYIVGSNVQYNTDVIFYINAHQDDEFEHFALDLIRDNENGKKQFFIQPNSGNGSSMLGEVNKAIKSMGKEFDMSTEAIKKDSIEKIRNVELIRSVKEYGIKEEDISFLHIDNIVSNEPGSYLLKNPEMRKRIDREMNAIVEEVNTIIKNNGFNGKQISFKGMYAHNTTMDGTKSDKGGGGFADHLAVRMASEKLAKEYGAKLTLYTNSDLSIKEPNAKFNHVQYNDKATDKELIKWRKALTSYYKFNPYEGYYAFPFGGYNGKTYNPNSAGSSLGASDKLGSFKLGTKTYDNYSMVYPNSIKGFQYRYEIQPYGKPYSK